ncbi:hypothetical protein I3760_01G257400 [Carya illinoinensis]|nr:hypothetical protein I3760_01G257400 [Carya illinoinensis]
MEALPSQSRSVLSFHSGKGGGGGGGPQRMIDEEELTMDAEQERRCRGVKEAQPTWIKLGLGIGSDSAAAKSPVTGH